MFWKNNCALGDTPKKNEKYIRNINFKQHILGISIQQ